MSEPVIRYSVTENIYAGLRAGAAHTVVMARDYDALAKKLRSAEASLQVAVEALKFYSQNHPNVYTNGVALAALKRMGEA